ncbi:alpha-hydroxy acid oxidase [Pseudoalteromonas ulvae]|uniref:Alpha-hydroxy-acid oxidizing enzyme n=1 Tax=Pseudoalteromonas ulvae TaxID=107327 RepID=A0A2C9ZZI6_PSEDV|nr:alpha-hydroxy acid oxidase [Pseudoalteromonas ulvae]OUL56179.1 alpha-hydroxy-acid oxidizing enzyme [Pseudoalteromonas ulvae]
MKPFDTPPQDIVSLHDYRRYAAKILPANAWHYIDGASADELTAQHNQHAFSRFHLKQRVLNGVTKVDTQVRLLTENHAFPLLLAPVAYQKLAHPSGEVGVMQAAAAQDIGYVLSTLSSTSLNEVIKYKASNSAWFQLYIQPQWSQTLQLIEQAEMAGYSALVITVDAPINGLRNREQRVGFCLPDGIAAVNIQGGNQPSSLEACLAVAPTWQTIEKIISATKLPVILKGISCVEDARLAKQLHLSGIVVSNHGGRVLDSTAPSINTLRAIREEVGQEMTVLLDSGIRRGTDVVKALALGANAVMIGRPMMYALATAGPLGVAHMLRILKDEIQMTMALCGCENVGKISGDILHDY